MEMAIRQFNDNFWQSFDIAVLSPEEKYLYLYLCTNKNLSMVGLYELNLAIVEKETGLKLADIKILLDKLENMLDIVYDNGVIFMSDYAKRQGGDKNKNFPSQVKGIYEKFKLNKDNKAVKLFVKKYKDIIEDKAVEIEYDTNDKMMQCFALWRRTPNYPEQCSFERLLSNYKFEEIKIAFHKAGENGKLSLPYVRGILQNNGSKQANRKDLGNRPDNGGSDGRTKAGSDLFRVKSAE